jgi:hypothetical protein
VEEVRHQLSFRSGRFARCDERLRALNENSMAVSLLFKHLDERKWLIVTSDSKANQFSWHLGGRQSFDL